MKKKWEQPKVISLTVNNNTLGGGPNIFLNETQASMPSPGNKYPFPTPGGGVAYAPLMSFYTS